MGHVLELYESVHPQKHTYHIQARPGPQEQGSARKLSALWDKFLCEVRQCRSDNILDSLPGKSQITKVPRGLDKRHDIEATILRQKLAGGLNIDRRGCRGGEFPADISL